MNQMRSRMRLLVLAVSTILLATLLAHGALALAPGNFEGNDGNLVVDTAGNTDWINAPHRSAQNDLPTGTTDNSFGQGTKESNVAVHVGLGSIPNSKADLARFATAYETIGTNTFLYLAWARANQSGTTNFDFEINQAAQPDLTTAGDKTLVRTAGDVLILYDFQGGAQHPTISISRWGAAGWSTPVVLPPAQAEAEVNRNAAVSDFLASPTVSRPTFQFGEAAINLTAAGVFPPGQCESFGSIYVKSRASNSFSAEVKDFIAPIPVSINNCATLVVKKVTSPDPDPLDTSFAFSETGPGSFSDSFSLKNGEQDSNTGLTPGTYTAAETLDANYDLTSATCDDGSPVTAIALAAAETVTCTFTNTLKVGAINISKVRKHAADGTGDHPFAGVHFTVDGSGDYVTAADGTICVGGLSLGDHVVHESVPTGYASVDDQTITVTQGTCASGAVAANFSNTPLTDVTITVNSQVDGGTNSTIDCDNNGLDGSSAANGDVSTSVTDQLPQTITCTITIDP